MKFNFTKFKAKTVFHTCSDSKDDFEKSRTEVWTKAPNFKKASRFVLKSLLRKNYKKDSILATKNLLLKVQKTNSCCRE